MRCSAWRILARKKKWRRRIYICGDRTWRTITIHHQNLMAQKMPFRLNCGKNCQIFVHLEKSSIAKNPKSPQSFCLYRNIWAWNRTSTLIFTFNFHPTKSASFWQNVKKLFSHSGLYGETNIKDFNQLRFF